MHGLYDKLQADGVTGPYTKVNGQMTLKPFVEYPKWVTKADGTRVVVKDLREEATMAGELMEPAKHDPLHVEREALAAAGEKLDKDRAELDELKAQMRAQLDELAQARAALQGGVAAQAKPAIPAAFGSTYRLPKDAAKAQAAVPTPEVEKVS